MRYMRNKHGVVGHYNKALLDDKTLGFVECLQDGSDIPQETPDEAPVEQVRRARSRGVTATLSAGLEHVDDAG